MPVSPSVESTQSKLALYREICEQLHNLHGNERHLVANAANTVALLNDRLPDVNWVGFYFTEEDEFVLGPFQGKPAPARIGKGQGVSGKAAQTMQTIIVPDVSKFDGYIVCDPASKSEIIVPLLNWGKLRGVLAVDSATLGRFDIDDEEGLESVAAVFMSSLVSDDLPDLSEEAAAG